MTHSLKRILQRDIVAVTLRSMATKHGKNLIFKPVGEVTWGFFPPLQGSLPLQGWKIHVGCCQSEMSAFLHRVVETLLCENTAFKIAGTMASILHLNSGQVNVPQTGKILTIYPRDSSHLRLLCLRLRHIWPQSAGPALRSDLWVHHMPHVGIRYGAYHVDKPNLMRPDGHIEEDRRSYKGVQPSWAPQPSVLAVHPTLENFERVFCAVGARFIPVHIMSQNAKGTVVLAVRQTAPFERVIIKTALRGIDRDPQGRDACFKLENEFKWLKKLNDLGLPVVRPLAFCVRTRAALVLEDVDGLKYGELPRELQICLLPELGRCVARLHEVGAAHRDLKPENVLCKAKELCLIDFELTSRLDDLDPLQGGTPGYHARLKAHDTPRRRDLYALGAILFFVALGIPPRLVPESRRSSLLRLHGLGPQADLFEAAICGHIDAASFAETCARVEDWQLRVDILSSSRAHRANARTTSRGARGLLRDTFTTGVHAHRSTCATLYDGMAGELLAMASLDTALRQRGLDAKLQEGCEWLADQPTGLADPGLFTGEAGIALALAVTGRRYREQTWLRQARLRFEKAVDCTHREVDLFSGVAGIVWAGTLLAGLLDEPNFLSMTRPLVEHLWGGMQESAGLQHWKTVTTPSKFEPPTLGASHGAAGIAMALAAWGRSAADTATYARAREVMLRLFQFGKTPDAQALRMWTTQPTRASNSSWCHGTAGFLWATLQEFAEDAAVDATVNWAAERVFAESVGGDTTYCHGLSGRLEVLRMAGRRKNLIGKANDATARVVTGLKFHTHTTASGQMRWPVDPLTDISTSLWRGFSGPAVALSMYACGSQEALLSAPWLKRMALPA